ncbi:hypothetical protein HGRIS_011117 [Hohenbuehelia grisea]|uniref:Ubiquitin-like domain-containing protein n=1 Tax=Hohenbuehelia grisea TaxID=104357 RepID=A0ABR3IZA6_9AGAR
MVISTSQHSPTHEPHFFYRAENFVIQNSVLNNVGGNQTNQTINTHHVNITNDPIPINDYQRPVRSPPVTSSLPRKELVTSCPVPKLRSNSNSYEDPLSLAIKLKSLMNEADCGPRILAELDGLIDALEFSDQASRALRFTALRNRARPLALPLMHRCSMALRTLCSDILPYRDVLGRRKGFSTLWVQVYWVGKWRRRELLQKDLESLRWPLESFLAALVSKALETLVYQSQDHLGHIRAFYANLRLRMPFLRHVPLITMTIIDHLGRTLPIPVDFCESIEETHRILQGYSKGTVGERYIRRSDYHLIHADDGHTVGSEEYANTEKPDAVFVVSIVMKRGTSTVVSLQKSCPRCGEISSRVPSDSGWVECALCL